MLHEGSCFIEFIKRVEEKRYTILLLFRNEFNKFNNTGAQMLVSIYHMIFKLHEIAFWREHFNMLLSSTQLYNGRHYIMLLNL